MMNTMSNSYNQEFFDKSKWETLSIPEIDALIEQFPYFSLLHLLKARKNKFDGINEDAVSFKRTTLYFINIPWLLYQYNQLPVFTKPEIEEVAINKIEENLNPVTETIENINIEDEETQEISKALATNETLEIEIEPTLDEFVIEQDELADELALELNHSQEEQIEINNDNNTNLKVSEEEIENSSDILEQIVQPVIEENFDLDTSIEPPPEIENEDNFIETNPILENSFEEYLEEEQIPIENIHGGDYFVAQGIHLDEVEKQEEIKLNFTTNSFLGWLRLMQRIKSDEEIEEQKDKNQHSGNDTKEINLKELDIFTETMADIYLNQGLKTKAIQIFEKLSLINPSKSAYFTSRINKINTN